MAWLRPRPAWAVDRIDWVFDFRYQPLSCDQPTPLRPTTGQWISGCKFLNADEIYHSETHGMRACKVRSSLLEKSSFWDKTLEENIHLDRDTLPLSNWCYGKRLKILIVVGLRRRAGTVAGSQSYLGRTVQWRPQLSGRGRQLWGRRPDGADCFTVLIQSRPAAPARTTSSWRTSRLASRAYQAPLTVQTETQFLTP